MWRELETYQDTSNVVREIIGRYQLSILNLPAHRAEAAALEVSVWLKAILDHQRTIFQYAEGASERLSLLHHYLLYATVSFMQDVGDKVLEHEGQSQYRVQLERVLAHALLSGLRALHFHKHYLPANSSHNLQVKIQAWHDKVSGRTRDVLEVCQQAVKLITPGINDFAPTTQTLLSPGAEVPLIHGTRVSKAQESIIVKRQ